MTMRVWITLGLLVCTAMLFTACGTPPVDAPAPTNTTDTADTTTTDAPVGAVTGDAVQLTAEEAQQIALTHAGLTADAVSELRAVYEIDDGRGEFEVHFRNGDYDYDYDIDAVTGQVISYDRDNNTTD